MVVKSNAYIYARIVQTLNTFIGMNNYFKNQTAALLASYMNA